MVNGRGNYATFPGMTVSFWDIRRPIGDLRPTEASFSGSGSV